MMKLLGVVISGGMLLASSAGCGEASQVNFSHLEHLTERILFQGDSVDIVHVYANYPEYDWVRAEDTGIEGIACVDDAARAAVVYLRHFEITKNQASLASAKGLLRFILSMQTSDGRFYNFILPDYSINRDGKTSFKSFGWWAARGVWSIALGVRCFDNVDAAFALRLQAAFSRSLPHVDSLLLHYGEQEVSSGLVIPQWLLYRSGADATSELLLGLIAYWSVHPDSLLETRIKKLCSGLMVMQDGNLHTEPFGVHRSWRTMWHMWGNSQTTVLAAAGSLLKDTAMIASAGLEAKGFYSRLLVDGLSKEMDVAHPERKTLFEQIAYAVRPMAVGLLRLFDATGDREYLIMAGLAASWFTGNNPTHHQMYDPLTGRGYDGITDSTTVNRNAGAESTIEALYTMLEIGEYRDAVHFSNFVKRSTGERKGSRFAIFADQKGEQVILSLDPRMPLVIEGDHVHEFLRTRGEDK